MVRASAASLAPGAAPRQADAEFAAAQWLGEAGSPVSRTGAPP